MTLNKNEPGAFPEMNPSLKTFIAASPVGIIVFDENARVLTANAPARKLFGTSPDAPGALKCGDFIACVHRRASAKGCGHTEYCTDCPLFRAIQAAVSRDANLSDLEGEALLARESGLPDIWVQFKIQSVMIDDRRAAFMAIDDITGQKRAHAALKESEERFRLMFMNAPMPYQSLDENGNFLEVNQSFLDVSGYEREDLIGMNFADILHPDWKNHFRQNFPRFKAVGEILGVEFEMVKKDGSPILVFFNGKIQRDTRGNFERTHCIFQDITEKRRAEEEFRSAEARHRKMIANIGDVIVIIGKDGINQYKSPNIEKWFGWKPDEVVGADSLANVHPEDRDFAAQFLASLSDEPNASGSAECRYLCKDGSYKWIEFTGVNLLHDPDIRGILGNYHDITVRKLAEEELRKRNRFIETILDNLPIGLAANRIDSGAGTYMNRQFENIYGWPREEIHDIDSFFGKVYQKPAAREKIRKRFREDIESGDPERMHWENLRITTRDGSKRMVTARNIPLFEQNLMISTVQDETQRVQAEKEHNRLREQLFQAQKMQSVGRLAGGVAHDYNNMLSVIMGYTEMAMEKVSPDDPLHADLSEVYKAAGRSTDITRQLLAFARKQTIDPKVLDLNETVESMLRMLRRLIGEDIDIAWHPGKKLWPVKLDPTQVNQVLANLCVNARDAISGVGSVTIETRNVVLDETYCMPHAESAPGEYVLLVVSDDGCGMDKETQKNIFEPFFTTKSTERGTGLGLATVYGIVKQNHGMVNVYSEPGKGATFRIYLPRHGSETPLEKGPGRDETPKSRGETVLLVEDEQAILRMGEMMLRQLGYTVLAADTPRSAIGMAKKHAGGIDLLITDVVMPEMNGRELAGELDALNPGLKVLFMSGYTANVIAHRGVLEDGMNFIQKPFSMHDLGTRTRIALDDA